MAKKETETVEEIVGDQKVLEAIKALTTAVADLGKDIKEVLRLAKAGRF